MQHTAVLPLFLFNSKEEKDEFLYMSSNVDNNCVVTATLLRR
ncbi:hypothetical protein PORCAN_1880 [Porphyromonas crevioricanis JCM 13913]|nr:hypothetical protein PORCAN_1880 [Porphyromonas crevioricanis JCM 13913]